MNSSKSPKQNLSSSDEIDLLAFIEVLWDRKWLIALITGIAILLGIGYHLAFNRSITASLKVQPLNPAEMSSFTALNKLKLIHELDSNNLLELYYKHLSSYNNAEQLFVARKLTDKSLKGEILRQSIMNYAEGNIKVSLKRPRVADTFKPYIQVEIRDNQRDELKPMLDSFVSWAADQTRDVLVRQFSVAISENEEQRDFEIERILTKIKGLKEKYYAEKGDQIKVLNDRIATIREAYAELKEDSIVRMKEQSVIAHNLGIAKPMDSTYENLPENTMVTQFNSSNQPMYLRGYLAIDNQIELALARENDDRFIPELRDAEKELLALTNRKNDEAYISELRTLEESIFVLQNDPFIDHAKALVDKLLSQNPEFRFVAMDLNGTSFRMLPGVKILLFFGILGVLSGISIVLVLAAIRYRKSLSIQP